MGPNCRAKRTRFMYAAPSPSQGEDPGEGYVVLAEIDSVANPRRWFVHGPTYIDEHVLVHDAVTGYEHFYLLKELYSVAGLANSAGDLAEAYRYDAYGKVHIFKKDNAAGDSDSDKDVDLADFAAFANCFNVDTSQDPSCDWADARDDDLITLDDYASIFPCQTGAYPPIVADGDYDQDSDVDSDDLNQFMTCWLDPPPSSACLTHFDFDGNGAIDIDDYGTVLGLINPQTPTCFVPANTSGMNPFFFTGQSVDFIGGVAAARVLYLYRERFFNPESGRFLSRDPMGASLLSVTASGGIELTTGTFQDFAEPLNVYEYARSRPGHFVDANGAQASPPPETKPPAPPDNPPAQSQPGPPGSQPTTQPDNPCKTNEQCCPCILYAESRSDPQCMNGILCVLQRRQALSNDAKWAGHFSGEGSFCGQTQVGKRIAGTWNQGYQDCCKCGTPPKTPDGDAMWRAAHHCANGCDRDPSQGAQFWGASRQAVVNAVGQINVSNGNCRIFGLPGCKQFFGVCKRPPRADGK
jgi:RHS repeat-associated protein